MLNKHQRWRRVGPLLALTVLVTGFGLLYSRLAIWKARSLMPEWGFDVTFFHNLLWNTAAGNGYRQSASYHEPPGIFNETHFEPIFVLATPIYKVAPGLETFYTVQSVLIALSAVGIFRIIRSAGASSLGGLMGALIFLMSWPIWRMNLADFRPLLWAIPFLILLVAALREGRRTEAGVWCALACLCREEVPVLVLGVLAVSLVWRLGRGRSARRQVFSLGLAVVAFMVATYLLRSNPNFYIRPMDWLRTLFGATDVDAAMAGYGHSAGDLLEARLDYLKDWLLPAGVGGLLAPEVLLASLPLFLYLFTRQDEWASWEGPYIHWTAPALALFAAAAALGWARFFVLLRLPKVISALVLLAVLGLQGTVIFGVPVLGGEGDPALRLDRNHAYWDRYIDLEVRPWLEQQPQVLEAHRLVSKVPADVSVMADDGRGDRPQPVGSLIHLLSGRAQLYSYQQEELQPVEPQETPLSSPLLPAAEDDPTWAIIHRADEAWIRRSLAAGLVEVDSGQHWVLLGQPQVD